MSEGDRFWGRGDDVIGHCELSPSAAEGDVYDPMVKRFESRYKSNMEARCCSVLISYIVREYTYS